MPAIPQVKAHTYVTVVDAATGLPASSGLNSGYISDARGNQLGVTEGFANIAAGATASSLVAAVPGFSIRVLAMIQSCGATATVSTFNSASAAISCLFSNVINGGKDLQFNQFGWFETLAGEALTVTTGTGATTGYQFSYCLVPQYTLSLNTGLDIGLNSGNTLGLND